jgi:hypothetical protein
MSTKLAAIANMEPGSFTDKDGRELIVQLIQSTYELAHLHEVLAIVASDEALVLYGLEREVIVPKPPLPAAAATVAQHKTFEVTLKEHNRQMDGLRAVQKALILTLDPAAKHVVSEPLHGVLRRSVLDIIALLQQHYGSMTQMEAVTFCNERMAQRFNEEEETITEFFVKFQSAMLLVEQNGNAQAVAQQVVALRKAFHHMTVFSNMAEAKFFQEAGTVAEQNVDTLIRVYKQVYRDQYISTTTAGQHGLTANQVVAPTLTAPDGVSASTRNTEDGFTPAQLAQIQVMITKAVSASALSGGQHRHGKDKDKAPYVKPPPIPAGVCPLHPTLPTPHTWDQCSRNPARKNK